MPTYPPLVTLPVANNYRVPLGAPPPRSEGGDDDDDEDEKEKEEEEPDYICASFADVSINITLRPSLDG